MTTQQIKEEFGPKDFRGFTTRKQLITVLGLLTGILHLFYGLWGFALNPLKVLFVLNFFGNVAFILALFFIPFFNDYRELIRWVYIGMTVSSIFFYVYINWSGVIINLLYPPRFFDKTLELLLVILLYMDRPLEKDPEEKPETVEEKKRMEQ